MPSFSFSLFAALLPQILLLGLAAVIGVLGLLRPRQRPDLHRWIAVIALVAAIAAAAVLLGALRRNPTGTAVSLWNGGLVVDRFSLSIVIVACVFALLCSLLIDSYMRRLGTRSAAFFALFLVATAAASAVAAEHEMMSLFIALVLLVLCLAALPAVAKTDSGGVRVAWTVLVEGGAATALVLYGLALIYGVSGDSNLTATAAALRRAPAVTTLGAALVLFGLAFPLGLLPLRRWTERVADSVAAVPAAFMTTLAMTAGAAALLRADAAGLSGVLHPSIGLGTVLVALALAAGSLLALRATTIARLITAAACGQAALLVLAVIAFDSGGLGEAPSAMLFALGIFGLAGIAAFAVLAMLQTAGLGGRLEDVRGLGHRSPAAAVFLALALATLAGVPPLGGFVARFIVVVTAFDAGYGWLGVVALGSTALTAIALMRVVAGLWADTGEEQPFTLLATPRLGRMVAVFCCLGAFYVSVLAQPLLLLARGGAGSVH